MIKVWGRKSSSNVQKVMWAIGELGLAYERIDAGGPFGGLNTAEYRARNPNGLIPVLQDGEAVIWESHAIIRYLAAEYGSGTLWAEDPAERSLSDRWMEWAATTLQPAFISGVFWGFYRTPPEKQDKPAIARAVAQTAHCFKLLDAHLADKDFVAGAQLTMGDISVGAPLFRYYTLEIERPALPHVEAYYARLQKRPAYREHVMVPYEELRGRLSF